MKWKKLISLLIINAIQAAKNKKQTYLNVKPSKAINGDGNLNLTFASIPPSSVNSPAPLTLVVGYSPPELQKPIVSPVPSTPQTITTTKPTPTETQPSQSSESPKPSISESSKPITEASKPTSAAPANTVTVTYTVTLTITVTASPPPQLSLSTIPTSDSPTPSATKTQTIDVFWALPLPHPTYGDTNWVAHLSSAPKLSVSSSTKDGKPTSSKKIPAPLVLEKINATNLSYSRLNRTMRRRPSRNVY